MKRTRTSLFCCLLLLYVCTGRVQAQCVGCTTTFASNSGANVTVSSGQTICINSGVTMSGQIFMNGGVLCNNGTVNNLKLSSGKGRIQNYGTIKDTETSINFAGTVFIYCFSASQFSFANVSLNMSSMDSLYFNLSAGANAYFSNDLSVGARKLSLVNSGTFRVNGDMNVNNARVQVINSGSVNVAGSINLSNAGNKVAINTGTITVGNSFNVGGNGSSAAVVTVWNSRLTTIGDALDCSMINGNFYLKNSATCNLGTDLVLTEVTDTLRNFGVLTVNNNITANEGIIYNDSILSCLADFDINGGKFTNYKQTNIDNAFIIQAGSEVRNQGLMITGDFNNSGKFRFGTQGLLQTTNYYHAAGDTIFGAATTVTDTVQYARMIITGYSRNTGYVRNNLMVFDQSLVHTSHNIDYGFDSVTTGGNISGSVLFYKKTLPPGTTGVVLNYVKNNFYFATASASAYTVNCGTPVTLNGLFFAPYTTHSPIVFGPGHSHMQLQDEVVPTSWTWNPGPYSGQSYNVTPTGTTTYTLSVVYMGQTYTTQVTVTVIPITLSISGGPDIPFAMPDAVTLSSTPGGGTSPYTYNWQPNAYFVNSTNNAQQNPQVSPATSVTYTLSVLDANGCPATATINVIAQPYAHLNKIPDGGHYKLFNNKLLFKYDGQYAGTTLVYTVYNKANAIITSGSFSSLQVNSGDNRYAYNASALPAGYYTLEILNEKREKLSLKFIR